jgi:hypothetical protein
MGTNLNHGLARYYYSELGQRNSRYLDARLRAIDGLRPVPPPMLTAREEFHKMMTTRSHWETAVKDNSKTRPEGHHWS